MKPQVKRRLPDLPALLDALKRDNVDAERAAAILRVAGYDPKMVKGESDETGKL